MKNITAFILVFFLSYCSNKKPAIIIEISTSKEVKGKGIITTDSSYVLNQDVLDIDFQKSSNEYIATQDIVEPKIGAPFCYVNSAIINEQGNPIRFKNSNEFLNFMNKGGYDMVSQIIISENTTKYVFKKNN